MEIRARCEADGVPAMCATTIRTVQVLALALQARRVFEVGTGYGLSALAVAATAPVDHLFTIERMAPRAAVARGFADRAGLGSRVSVMVGEAARLVHKVSGPFDLVVQDGDPAAHGAMLDRLVALLRPGGLLITHRSSGASHAAPGPAVAGAYDGDAAAVRASDQQLAADPRLFTVCLPVGGGLAVSVRTERAA